MRVIWSTSARRDLRAIALHIAEDNPRRAESFVAELIQRARELAEFPRRFPIEPGLGDLEVRRRLYRNHLIFYEIGSARITVLRVVHGARDYRAELIQEP